MLKFLATTSAALLAFLSAASAAPSPCPQHFLDGEQPAVINPKLAACTQEICYEGYAVLHSGTTRTPLWSAEHLTRERIEAAHHVRRVNEFHPDPHLPPGERAMPDAQSQEESFSLANMIPQNPNNNRHLWEGIESAVRSLAVRAGGVSLSTTDPAVVTSPATSKRSLKESGMPANGEGTPPRPRCASITSAAARAPSASTLRKVQLPPHCRLRCVPNIPRPGGGWSCDRQRGRRRVVLTSSR